MLRKAVHRGYRNHTEVIRCLLESSKHFLHKGLRFIQQLLCAAHIVADELDCLPLHFGGECIQRFIVGIKVVLLISARSAISLTVIFSMGFSRSKSINVF